MTESDEYDVIVLGVGGMGSATVFTLAERGYDVLGLERFDVPHSRGSSHGLTRIIRKAYFEDTFYLPLLERAYERWRSLESRVDEQLLHTTGSVTAGPPGDAEVERARAACQRYDLAYETLSGAEVSERFPGYSPPAEFEALYQPDGGFLASDRCLVGYVSEAIDEGADVRARERVTEWEAPTADEVRVETTKGSYTADALVATVGSWTGSLFPTMADALEPERQVLAWLRPENPIEFGPDRFPVFTFTVEEGDFYGFPAYGVPGFKFGKHHHRNETVDPDAFEREPTAADERVLREFADRYFPAGAGPTLRLEPCLYTNTPDEHFVLDRHPAHPNVAVAAGFSGHGFKFCSVVGEIMTDLAVDGTTDHDIEPFAIDRF
jgi:sarcosine oxidase